MTKCVIFDMDGLMIDSERVTCRAYNEVAPKYNFPMSVKFFKDEMIGHNVAYMRDLFRRVAGEGFPSEAYIADVYDWVARDFYEVSGIPVKTGLRELLAYIKEQGWKVYVATSSSHDRVKKIIETAGIADYFNGSVCGDEVKRGKPDPETFEVALKKAGVKPEEAYVIEDSELGIEAAHRAGIPAICVPDMIDPRQEIRDMTVYIGETLLDVLDYLKAQEV